MPDICVVIPCYNEEKRLNVPAVSAFLSEQPKLMLVFVDDGSRDGTGVMLEELVKRFPWQIRVVTLERNGGKAEAVRAGMAAAVESEAPLVGYWDADFSTPLRLIPVMAELFEGKPRLEIVCGCRLQRLGADIRRSVFRHLVGRCFATLASLFLRLPVYDTQCGAKLLRVRTGENPVPGAAGHAVDFRCGAFFAFHPVFRAEGGAAADLRVSAAGVAGRFQFDPDSVVRAPDSAGILADRRRHPPPSARQVSLLPIFS